MVHDQSTDQCFLVYIGSGANMLLTEIVLDGDYTRLALLATAPFLFCVSIVRQLYFSTLSTVPHSRLQFFSCQIVANITMCIGPVAQFHENSKYYSAVPSPANKEVDSKLPHVTIEMPVYKESLAETMYALPPSSVLRFAYLENAVRHQYTP
jgi:hypothetical protein